MRRRVKKSALLLVGVGVMAAVITPVVIAATGDTDDNIKPASTLVKTTLKSGTKTTFTVTKNNTTLIQHCTASSTSGKTPATGLGPVAVTAPTFTGCTDNIGGTDTVKTSGSWKLTFIDVASDEAAEKTGDKLKITVPIKGATVTSNLTPGCTITAAPTAAVNVTGAYNDVNTLTITSAPVPVSFSSGCGTLLAGPATAHFTATYVLSPGIHDAS
jgi:hypothetical protein